MIDNTNHVDFNCEEFIFGEYFNYSKSMKIDLFLIGIMRRQDYQTRTSFVESSAFFWTSHSNNTLFVGKDFQMLILIKLATLSMVLSFGTSHVGKDFQIKVSLWSFCKLLTLCSGFSFIISSIGNVFQSLIVIKLLAMVSSSSTSLVGRDSQIKKPLR